jgi:hypothetical protein
MSYTLLSILQIRNTSIAGAVFAPCDESIERSCYTLCFNIHGSILPILRESNYTKRSGLFSGRETKSNSLYFALYRYPVLAFRFLLHAINDFPYAFAQL